MRPAHWTTYGIFHLLLGMKTRPGIISLHECPPEADRAGKQSLSGELTLSSYHRILAHTIFYFIR